MPFIAPNVTYTSNGSPLFVLAGSSGATQTLTFDVATNGLSISGGNTVTLTPTDLFIPGLVEIGGTLGVTGGSTLGDGFVSNGDSVVTRPSAGTDALLVVRNFDGDGVAVAAKDGSGAVNLKVVTSGSVTAT